MRLSEFIGRLRPARFQDKAGAFLWGSANGEDVRLPYQQAGWFNLADGQYTSSAPLTILAGVKTQITIDGLGAATNVTYANGMAADVWSGNRLNPSDIGETYNVRLTFTVEQETSGTGHFVTVEADIGTDLVPFIAASQSVPLLKSQDSPTLVTQSYQFFCLDTFGRNGARLFITPSVDVTLYGAAIFIQRTFKP